MYVNALTRMGDVMRRLGDGGAEVRLKEKQGK